MKLQETIVINGIRYEKGTELSDNEYIDLLKKQREIENRHKKIVTNYVRK